MSNRSVVAQAIRQVMHLRYWLLATDRANPPAVDHTPTKNTHKLTVCSTLATTVEDPLKP